MKPAAQAIGRIPFGRSTFGKIAETPITKDFVKNIDVMGIPDVVSFDNDLIDIIDSSITTDQMVEMMEMRNWRNFKVKTGAHCAEYLVEKCKEIGVPIPKYYIHTANSM
jgi:hypothetical protein